MLKGKEIPTEETFSNKTWRQLLATNMQNNHENTVLYSKYASQSICLVLHLADLFLYWNSRLLISFKLTTNSEHMLVFFLLRLILLLKTMHSFFPTSAFIYFKKYFQLTKDVHWCLVIVQLSTTNCTNNRNAPIPHIITMLS